MKFFCTPFFFLISVSYASEAVILKKQETQHHQLHSEVKASFTKEGETMARYDLLLKLLRLFFLKCGRAIGAALALGVEVSFGRAIFYCNKSYFLKVHFIIIIRLNLAFSFLSI